MGEQTKIEWCDHTFNPWRGCVHKSDDGVAHPACDHCYAEALSKRNPGTLGTWGAEGTRVKAAKEYWRLPAKWNAAAEKEGVRKRVFCASLADVFEDWQGEIRDHKGKILHRCRAGHLLGLDAVYAYGTECKSGCNRASHVLTMNDLRRDLVAVIDETPMLDWLLLTKRPENVRGMWNDLDERPAGVLQRCRRPNVWLGTSISDQRTADIYVPELLKLRELCPVLFLSIEPLLGPVNLAYALPSSEGIVATQNGPWHVSDGAPQVDWIIVGGESGPHARPMHPAWARGLRDQCQAADVPFFFKQGSSANWGKFKDFNSFPTDLQIRELPGLVNDFGGGAE